jgi:hypothetical protein
LCPYVVSFQFAPKVTPDYLPLILAGVLTKAWLARPPLARASMPNPMILPARPPKSIHNI